MPPPPLTPETFWLQTRQEGDCLVWTRARAPKGYGTLRWRGRMAIASRVAWVLTNGPIPPNMIVCHTCDNPPCVNPAHLFLGTNEDNQRDRWTKGRTSLAGRSGEANSQARLTADQVRQIRLRAAAGESHRTLAAAFSLSHQTVGKIVRRQKWASLPD